MVTIIFNWFADPKNWGALLITSPIAIAALIVAVKNYQRKSGIDISGAFGIASSARCEDCYVSYIVLENLKDRAVTIYSIHLKVGHNLYIELEDHEKTPLILKPYETYHKKFGEIVFYAANTNKVRMRKVLEDKRAKKRLVLSTSAGKYTIPKEAKRWSPIGEFFKNYLTGIIKTIRVTHNDESVGGNVRFIVEITQKDGHKETIQLMASDYQLKMFRNFNLTEECLQSKETLEAFLEEKRSLNLIPENSSIKVYDFEKHKNSISESYSAQPLEAERLDASYYYIFGRIYTWHSNFKITRENKRNQKNRI